MSARSISRVERTYRSLVVLLLPRPQVLFHTANAHPASRACRIPKGAGLARCDGTHESPAEDRSVAASVSQFGASSPSGLSRSLAAARRGEQIDGNGDQGVTR